VRIPSSSHRPIHHTPATKPAPSTIAADYKKGFDKAGYKLIADPEKDLSLRGTKALALYKNTLGEGKNLDLCTDGDHLVYRSKSGQICVTTFPEDSSRGDGLWVFDKTGNKLLEQGVAIDGKLKMR
jgi:hypothetical protein